MKLCGSVNWYRIGWIIVVLNLLFSPAFSYSQNLPPVIDRGIPNQHTEVGNAYSYPIPSNAFRDENNETLSYTTSSLPSWLNFDPGTRQFTGTPTSTTTSNITVTATDPSGTTSAYSFKIYVHAAGSTYAAFSMNTQTGCNYKEISFTNFSKNATSYSWIFGNGNTATDVLNPSAIYSTPGTYTVTLIINGGGAPELTHTEKITIYPFPKPEVGNVLDKVCEPANLLFNSTGEQVYIPATTINGQTVGDISSASEAYYHWYFFEKHAEQYSFSKNTTINNFQGGTYNIILEVTDANGCEGSVYKSNFVDIYSKPVADFTIDKTDICNPSTTNFTNNSQLLGNDSITTHAWSLNGSPVATTKDYSVFLNLGTTNISLRETSSKNCVSELVTKSVVFNSNNTADFTFNGNNCFGDTVQFYDNSPNATSFEWDFNNDNIVDSNLPNPIWRFNNPGNQRVSLKAHFSDGCVIEVIKNVSIEEVIANFDYIFTDACAPDFRIRFTDQSNPSYNRSWHQVFDDNSTLLLSTLSTFEHIFPGNGGSYRIRLVATNENGCSATVEKTITAGRPSISINTSGAVFGCVTGAPTNFATTFTSSHDSPSSYLWNFGDSGTDIGATPSHTYAAGDFNVGVTITTTLGCSYSATSTNAVRLGNAPIISGVTINQSALKCYSEGVELVVNSSVATDSLRFITPYATIEQALPDNTLNYQFPTIGVYQIDVIAFDNGCPSNIFPVTNIEINEPQARFTPVKTTFCDDPPYKAEFTNESSYSDPLTQFNWTFGDGTSSTDASPEHEYASTGNFAVTLTTTSTSGCSDTFRDTIRIYSFEDATNIITADKTEGCAPYEVSFSQTINSNLSPNYVVREYQWDFDNNGTIDTIVTTPSVKYIFTKPENYSVRLVAINEAGSCNYEFIEPNFIKVSGPIASFNFSPAVACLDEEITFTNTSTKMAFDSANPLNDSYSWNFGDGTTSTEENPKKTYTRDSVFTASLTVTDETNCSAKKEVLIAINPLEASIQLSDTIFCAGTTVTFTNNSTGIISSYLWDFDNNGTTDLTTFNTNSVQWNFSTPGNFHPTLTAVAPNGCTKTNSAEVRIVNPTAEFSAIQQNIGCAPAFAYFEPVANADEVISYNWNFGDGNGSNERSPRNYYVTPGKYTISLQIDFKGGCSRTVVKNEYITADGAFGKLDYDKTLGCLPNAVLFSVSEMSRVDIISWDFGKGEIPKDTLSGQPSYTERTYSYNSGGYASPSIILTDDVCGEYTYNNPFKGSIYTSTPPVAGFTVDKDSVCKGVEIQFTNTSVSTDPLYAISSWKWDFGMSSTSDTSRLKDPTFAYDDIGIFGPTLIVANPLGCVDTLVKPDYIQIFGNNNLTANFNISDDKACANQLVNFSSLANAGPISTIQKYEWNFGSGFTTGTNTSSFNWDEPFKGESIDIIHRVTDDKECTASTTRTVEIDNLQADFGYSPQPVFRGSSVVYTNLSVSNYGALSYQWSFTGGNNPTALDKDPVIQYNSLGENFRTELIVRNTNLCSDTTFKLFDVINNPPVIDSFIITIVENHSHKFTASEFTANNNFDPKDPNQNLEAIRFETTAANGTVLLNGTTVNLMQTITVSDIPQLRFVPDSDWNGKTQLEWNGYDGTDWAASTASIYVDVLEEPDPPTLINIEFNLPEDSVIRITRKDFIDHISTVLGSAFEFDSLQILSNINPLGGTLTFNGSTIIPSLILGNQIDNANQVFEFTPPPGSNLSFWFDWNAFDGYNFAISPAKVIIYYYNSAPILSDIIRTGLAENSTQTDFQVDFALSYLDRDIHDTPQTFRLVSLPPSSEGDFWFGSQKVVTGNFSIPINNLFRLRFQPATGFEGTTSAIYSASDGTSTGTARIFLTFENTPPIVHDFTAIGSEDNELTFAATQFSKKFTLGGPFEDADASDNLNTIRITSLPANGTLRFQNNIVSEGTEILSTAIGQLKYSSNLDWFGNDSFTYNAFDGTDWAATNATVILDIQPVNDAPRPEADAWNTDEDIIVTGISVATNDIDVDDLKTALTYSVAVTDSFTAGLHGTIDLRPNGDLTFIPEQDFVGTIYFIYTVCDDDNACAKDTTTITIRPLNDAPDAADDFFDIDENEASKNFNCLDNDKDVDNDPIEVTTVEGDLTGSIIGTYGILQWYKTGDLIFTLNTGLDSLNRTDLVSETYTYTIEDTLGITATATFTIRIHGLNNAPDAIDDYFYIYEGESSTSNNDAAFETIIFNDTDTDGDLLHVADVNNSPLIKSITGNYGTFNWQPNGSWSFDLNQNAVDSLKKEQVVDLQYPYSVSDGVDVGLGEIKIDIIGVNDAPVAVDNTLTISEDDLSVTISTSQAEALLKNDTDVDHDNLTVIELEGDIYGSVQSEIGLLQWNADGSYTYTPDRDTVNTIADGARIFDYFNYTIIDEFDSTATAQLIIIIEGLNDIPVAQNDYLGIFEDNHITIVADSLGLLSNDNDIDRDPIVVAVNDQNLFIQDGNYGTLAWGTEGGFTYQTFQPIVDTLYQGEAVIDSFSYTVLDNHSAQSTAKLFITITGQNDAPVANNHNESILESKSVITVLTRAEGILKEDSDIDDHEEFGIVLIDDQTSNIISGNYGELEWKWDGTFTYTLNSEIDTLAALEMVIDTFRYVIQDRFDSTAQAYFIIQITGENDNPTAENDTLTVTENDIQKISAVSLLLNDEDTDGDPIEMFSLNTSTISPSATNFASIDWNKNGKYIYNRYEHSDLRNGLDTLAFDDVVTDSIPYSIIDTNLTQNQAYLYLLISGVNDNPVAITDSNFILETTPSISSNELNHLLANDYDIDRRDSVEVRRVNFDEETVTEGKFGILEWHNNGSYNYTLKTEATDSLAEGELLKEVFKYTIFDTQNTQDHDSLIISIQGVNDAPIAENDTIQVPEDIKAIVFSGDLNNGILANDSDIDGDSIYVKLDYNVYDQEFIGIYGKLTIHSNGISEYLLNDDIDSLFIGESVIDTFAYTISDIHDSTANALIIFQITGANDAPIAVDNRIRIDEDTDQITISLDSIASLLSNDYDIDKDTLWVKSINDSLTSIVSTYGELQWDSLGAYTFITNKLEADKLALGDTVVEAFNYVISDSHDGDADAWLYIEIIGVNDAPFAIEDTFETFDIAHVVVLPTDTNILTNDYDVDGTLFPIIKIDNLENQIIQGAWGLLSWAPDGSFSYEPDSTAAVALRPNELNVDQFEYIITDEHEATDTSLITINIWGINNYPIARIDTISIEEDDLSATLDLTNGLLRNDEDPDRDTLFVIEFNDQANNTINDIYGNIFWTALGKVVFTPNREIVDQLGHEKYISRTFNYTIADEEGLPASSELIVIILGENDPITAINDTLNILEDKYGRINVVENDVDVDNDSLGNFDYSSLMIIEQPSNGKAYVNSANGEISYFPNKDFSGTDSLQYQICDTGDPVYCNKAWFIINVESVNDIPVAKHLTFTTMVDETVQFNAFKQVSDVDDGIDSTSLIITETDKITRTGDTISFVSPQVEIAEFTYSISDSTGAAATVIVTVIVKSESDNFAAQNDSVIINENTFANIAILTNDTIGGHLSDPLSVNIKVYAENGIATYNVGSRTINYQPEKDFFGKDSLIYLVGSTSGYWDFATVYIDVISWNSPIIVRKDAVAIFKGEKAIIPILENDFDLDNGTNSQSVQFDIPSNGTATYNSNNELLTYTPDAAFIGTDIFNYTVCDLDTATPSCGTATITVLVKSQDNPIANNDFYTTNEGPRLVIDNPHPIDNDTDATGKYGTIDKNSFEVVVGPQHGTYTLDTLDIDKNISYIPDSNYFGPDWITYMVCDSVGCDFAEINIWVNEVNNDPVANDDNVVVTQNATQRIFVLSNDFDIDGQLDWNSLEIMTPPDKEKGVCILDKTTGTILYTPLTNTTEDIFTYKICDAEGKCAIAKVFVIIDLGTTIIETIVTNEDTPATIDLTPLLADKNLFISITDAFELVAPKIGTWQLINNNYLVYTPEHDSTGTDYLNLTICSNAQVCADLRILVTVTPVNDAPVAVNDTIIWNTGSDATIISFNDLLQNDYDVDGDSIMLSAGAVEWGDSLHVDFGNYSDSTITISADTILWCNAWFTYKITDPDSSFSIGRVFIFPAPDSYDLIATDDFDSINENSTTPIAIDILFNDVFKDNQRCTIDTILIITPPINGIAAINENNFALYQPNIQYWGLDSLQYVIKDIWEKQDTAWVYIDVLQRNTPPVATNDVAIYQFYNNITIPVLGNDYDPDDPYGFIIASLTQLVIDNGPFSGTVYYDTINNQFIYTPIEITCEGDSFEYVIYDNEGGIDTALVNIKLPAELPIAVTDTVYTWPSIPVEFNPIINDRGYFIPHIADFTQPYSGRAGVSQISDSILAYHPDPDFFERDSMQYTIHSLCGEPQTGWVIFMIKELRVPEIITPNGDSKNDVLIIDGIEYFPDALLQIFNRYGHIVYQRKGYDNDWGGNSNQGSFLSDETLPSGPYYYTLTYNEGRNKQAGLIYIYQ